MNCMRKYFDYDLNSQNALFVFYEQYFLYYKLLKSKTCEYNKWHCKMVSAFEMSR